MFWILDKVGYVWYNWVFVSENAIFVFEKNQMNTWKVINTLQHCFSTPYCTSKTILTTVSRKKVQFVSRCQTIWQTIYILCKKPVKNWLLCVARENLRLKNSYICTKIWLPATQITRTRKQQHIILAQSISVCIMVIKTSKNWQKLYVFIHSIRTLYPN